MCDANNHWPYGLVLTVVNEGCHKKLRNGVSDLARKAFTLLHVHNNPFIHTVRVMHSVKVQPYV